MACTCPRRLRVIYRIDFTRVVDSVGGDDTPVRLCVFKEADARAGRESGWPGVVVDAVAWGLSNTCAHGSASSRFHL